MSNKRTRTIIALTGIHSDREVTVYVCDEKYYVQHAGTIVNLTNCELVDNVKIENINDLDAFTWGKPIESEEDLMLAVDA